MYREVFTGLREMGRHHAPISLTTSVIAQLKVDGRIYERKVSLTQKLLSRFLSMPGLAKYPLAAGIVVAALYAPIAAVLSVSGGSLGGVSGLITQAVVQTRNALTSVSFLAGFFDSISAYSRATKTVFQAVVTSAGGNLMLFSVGLASLMAIVFVISFVAKRSKRSIRNAPMSFL
jgi:hypothetical protein